MPNSGSSGVPAEGGGADQDDRFTPGDFSVDEYMPIKVAVIGAGFSGICAGARFPQKIPNVQLTIYEKSSGVGGTWYNNRFPGIACDIPAHSYQLSFTEKNDWSSFYAPGHEIQQHLEEVVEKYKLMRYIKLNHEMVHARYDEPTGKWHLRIRRPNLANDELEEFEDVVDVMFTAIGALSRWEWPNIDGLKDYKGELHHTAGFNPPEKTWEEAVEKWKNKKVGVIGVGSTAIQVVPALQPRVAKIVNYVRGQAWISPPFVVDLLCQYLGRDKTAPEDALTFTPEEMERLKTDREFSRNFRHVMENMANSMHSYTQRDSALQIQLQQVFRTDMKERLAKKPWIADTLLPGFPVACRRLTPGVGYLEALCQDNAEFITSPIKRLTETGIETEDGQHEELDIIFCATGYDTSWQLPFKIIGRGGVDLNDKWRPHPVSYLSVCVDGFPNMFMSLGPNSVIGAGSLLPIMESAVMYAVQATAKIQRERIKSMEVKAEAVKDFDQYIESYFPQAVFSQDCRSWYKRGMDSGRIVGLWPGSNLHAKRVLEHPRWEDYNYERVDAVQNRLYWLGDGQTWNEKTQTGDRAWYLDEKYIDRPPVPVDGEQDT